MAGEAGTPLPRKLGIDPGHEVALIGAPDGLARDLGPLPGVTLSAGLGGSGPFDVIVTFLHFV